VCWGFGSIAFGIGTVSSRLFLKSFSPFPAGHGRHVPRFFYYQRENYFFVCENMSIEYFRGFLSPLVLLSRYW
jgi:hypothetical protein